MMPSILEVKDLRKVYRVPDGTGETGNLVAVGGLSFGVHAGGSLAIVGESGSGKTTTARIIAGLETATSGQIRIDGDTRTPLPWAKRDRTRYSRQVQMVFQDPYSSLDRSQTIEASLDEVLRCHTRQNRNARSSRISELLAQCGLDNRHRRRRPAALSGGERQRVAIARALAVEPRVLILDEAVSALDVSIQAQILNLLASLRRSLGLTYIFISHDIGVVRQVSDDCIVMRQGMVAESGDTATVLSAPSSDYTRQLLDAIPRPGWAPKRRVAADRDAEAQSQPGPLTGSPGLSMRRCPQADGEPNDDLESSPAGRNEPPRLVRARIAP
jgi:peptide/nickel transport system ATP-binding protein